ncbi:hypothetical protein PGTUg99_022795 [Puccinia graminis f. sp. tritici]|uniref:Uncharacterized protein n=1 Tax=Puccinia graminis f. sp. tritici TaxID=56615 RepID=A0A5B0RCR8_PUCGR|nr:hypothetical protein PGTUg99_022795 [Puccinia graminis f. sp. tritici]
MGPINNHPTQQEFQVLKQEILYYEDILLRTLCFDLAVDHPYVSLIHSVKFIHESHTWAQPSKSSIAVKMADRAKAKSITRPPGAFLLAISHHLSKSPPSYPDQEGNHREPHNIEKNPVDFHCFLNHPPRDGPKEGLIQ